MPEHASRRLLFESLGISVIDFRCHACVEQLGTEEPNPTHSIVLVRRGVFGRSHEGRTLVADPNNVLFFNAAEGYRYSHPVAGGDDCTILAVESARALELVARHAPRDPRPESPFRLGHGLSSRRAAELHWELLQLVDRAGRFGCSPFHLSRTFHGTVGMNLRRYVTRLRARLAAERLAAGARDLTGLALQLGYFDHSHFTRSFRNEWGIPPSRFRAEQ